MGIWVVMVGSSWAAAGRAFWRGMAAERGGLVSLSSCQPLLGADAQCLRLFKLSSERPELFSSQTACLWVSLLVLGQQ